MIIFENIFYQLYRTIKKSGGNTPVESAALLFAFIQLLNITLIVAILKPIFGIDLLAKINKVIFVLLFIGLILLNIIFIHYKKWHERIITKKQTLTSRQNKKLWNYTLTYMFVSFILICIVFPLIN